MQVADTGVCVCVCVCVCVPKAWWCGCMVSFEKYAFVWVTALLSSLKKQERNLVIGPLGLDFDIRIAHNCVPMKTLQVKIETRILHTHTQTEYSLVPRHMTLLIGVAWSIVPPNKVGDLLILSMAPGLFIMHQATLYDHLHSSYLLCFARGFKHTHIHPLTHTHTPTLICICIL